MGFMGVWEGQNKAIGVENLVAMPMPPTGGPLSDRVVRDRFYRILENADLRRQRFHDLRHSCASLMIAQGVQSREVMEQLGHSTIVMTLNRYAHIFKEAQTETAKKMGQILTG